MQKQTISQEFDDKLQQFMMFHDLDVKKENKTTFRLELSENELIGALETLTGHRIPKDLHGRESIFLEDDETLDEQSRKIFAKWQAAWAKWWFEHYLEFVTVVVLAEVAEVSTTDDPVERAGVEKFGLRFPVGRDVHLGSVHEVVLGNDGLMDSRCCLDFDYHQVMQVREGISEFPYTDDVWMTDPCLAPVQKANPWSRARQEAEVKPRFLTVAALNHTVPNRGLVFGQVLTHLS